jgi:hypothetical protein
MASRNTDTPDEIDIHDVYNSIRDYQIKLDKTYEDIAIRLLNKVRNNIDKRRVSNVKDNQISTEIVWRFKSSGKKVCGLSKNVHKSILNQSLLNDKIGKRLHLYKVHVNHATYTPNGYWDMLSNTRYIYSSSKLRGALFRMFVLPVDIILLPIVLAHNGFIKLKNGAVGQRYKSTITLEIPRHLMDNLENLQPGAPGFLEIRDRFNREYNNMGV